MVTILPNYTTINDANGQHLVLDKGATAPNTVAKSSDGSAVPSNMQNTYDPKSGTNVPVYNSNGTPNNSNAGGGTNAGQAGTDGPQTAAAYAQYQKTQSTADYNAWMASKGLGPDGQPINSGTPANTSQPTPATTPTPSITTKLPGGNATTLFQYYGAKGQALPDVATRGTLYQQLGLGAAAEYKGTAEQNTELLDKLQLQDHSTSTFGSKDAQAAAGLTPQQQAENGTPAGTSLASALSGVDAASSLENYKTYLSSSLGVAASNVDADNKAINDFFGAGYKTADQILSEEMDRQGVSGMNTTLAELDKQIQTQSDTLDRLPDDIKNTLQDVGVSQAQLDRLVTKESKPATTALTKLMQERNATASEIDKAMSYAKDFADTRVSAQAAKLSYLEWQLTSDKGDYNKLDADVKSTMTAAVADQKQILSTALTAAKNGASSDVIDSILGSGSAAEAIQNAGSSLVTPRKTPASKTPAGSMSSDIASAGQYLEVGSADKGYNGRGPDGYVDPHLYVALYNAAAQQYGSAGQAAFIKKYPPAKNINPANLNAGTLPTALYNAVFAAQKVQKTTATIKFK